MAVILTKCLTDVMASVSSEKVTEALKSLSAAKTGLPSIIPPASQCSYAACYCEENVYQLVSRLPRPALALASVVFISNQDRCVPLW